MTFLRQGFAYAEPARDREWRVFNNGIVPRWPEVSSQWPGTPRLPEARWARHATGCQRSPWARANKVTLVLVALLAGPELETTERQKIRLTKGERLRD